MTIGRAHLRSISNALTLRMSGKQICFQIVRSQQLDCANDWAVYSSDRKCTGPKSVAVNSSSSLPLPARYSTAVT